VAAFRAAFPGIAAFLAAAVDAASTDGYAETLFSRRRFLPGIHSRDGGERARATRQAVNSVVQGSGADLLKIALANIATRFARELPAALRVAEEGARVAAQAASGAIDPLACLPPAVRREAATAAAPLHPISGLPLLYAEPAEAGRGGGSSAGNSGSPAPDGSVRMRCPSKPAAGGTAFASFPACDPVPVGGVEACVPLVDPTPPARILMQVHDEVLAEVRTEVLPQALRIVRDCMTASVALSVPLAVTLAVGPSWGDMAELPPHLAGLHAADEPALQAWAAGLQCTPLPRL
jgi:hypothetical protein